MCNSKFRKLVSIFLSLIMIISIVPISLISLAAESTYAVMKSYASATAANNDDYHAYKDSIISVTFLDKIDNEAVNNAVLHWDVSEKQNNSVIAWMIKNIDESNSAGADRYDVFIAANGGIWANPDSSNLFFNFKKLRNVYGLEYFHTEKAETLAYFFEKCYELKEADLSTFDTSNVTDFTYFFDNCQKLERVNFSGWNTSNVTNMSYMFNNCYILSELDLSSFDTRKVTNMMKMFYQCKELKTIYISDYWRVEQVTASNQMFNCCYAIVGGKEIYDKDFQYFSPGIEYAKLKEDGGFLTHESEKPLPEIKEYKVTYEFIGDIIPDGVILTEDELYTEGSTVTVAKLPEADGFIFSGWSTDDADISTGSFIINNDVHIIGSWDKLYNVKYEFRGFIPENPPELVSYQHKSGDLVKLDDVPFIHGYVFAGWITEDVTVTDNIFEMPPNDVVIYGSFRKPVESVEINGGNIVLNIYDKKVINVSVNPEDATIKDIIYSSDNEAVAKIDEMSNLIAVGEGNATITVYSKDDPTKKRFNYSYSKNSCNSSCNTRGSAKIPHLLWKN